MNVGTPEFKMVTFNITQKNEIYLDVNLTKHVQDVYENCKILTKEIK